MRAGYCWWFRKCTHSFEGHSKKEYIFHIVLAFIESSLSMLREHYWTVGTKLSPSNRRNMGQNKSATLLLSFLTFLHYSALRNLAVRMMSISHSGSKLQTDYDYFVIIPLICWSWLHSFPLNISINPDRTTGLLIRKSKIFFPIAKEKILTSTFFVHRNNG